MTDRRTAEPQDRALPDAYRPSSGTAPKSPNGTPPPTENPSKPKDERAPGQPVATRAVLADRVRHSLRSAELRRRLRGHRRECNLRGTRRRAEPVSDGAVVRATGAMQQPNLVSAEFSGWPAGAQFAQRTPAGPEIGNVPHLYGYPRTGSLAESAPDRGARLVTNGSVTDRKSNHCRRVVADILRPDNDDTENLVRGLFSADPARWAGTSSRPTAPWHSARDSLGQLTQQSNMRRTTRVRIDRPERRKPSSD